MSSISTDNLLSQSKYLYLQSAGSDGSDGSASGIHLRWDLLGTLGEQHLPKGDLAASGTYYTTAKYNKADDYVKIYRTTYNRNYPLLVNLAAPPSAVDDAARTWHYNSVVANPNLPGTTRNVIVRFPNDSYYRKVRNVYNPASDPVNFLIRYNAMDGIIEVEVEGKLMFASYVFMKAVDLNKPNTTRLESISPEENTTSNNSLFISGRRKYTIEEGCIEKEDTFLLEKEDTYKLLLDQLGDGSRKLIAENIQYIRFKGDNCYPSYLWLETYDDFLLGKNQTSEWQQVSSLALSVTQADVFKRLEDTSVCKINNLWPRYKDNYKVDVALYQEKWFDAVDTESLTVEGLNSAITNYLTLSKDPNNLYAYNSSAYTSSGNNFITGDDSDDPSPEINEAQQKEQEYSLGYLNLLKVVALDFHIARMLGLATIDAAAGADKYMYIAVYDTNDAIDSITTAARHTYMTIPTAKTDYKLPYTPELGNIRYGLSVSMGDTQKKMLTDENGYYKYAASRAINLDLIEDGAPYDFDPNTFFVPDQEYSFADYTKPIMYGVKYHQVGSTDAWVDLSVDETIKDQNGLYEVMPLMDLGTNPLYTHIEKNIGQHEYALYGINWFSRSSALSAIKQTDTTHFDVVETFLPPQNFCVQLIQKEDICILTSLSEQKRLSDLTSTDKTLVRVTFDWNNANYANYWYGRKAQFFFRTEGVNLVRGKVKSVSKINDTTYEVRTTSYNITTTSPTTVVIPTLTSDKLANYKESLFTSNGNQYVVSSVVLSSVSGEGPVFYVQPLVDTSATDKDNTGVNTLSEKITIPIASEIFSVSENTTLPGCWSKTLTKTVNLQCLGTDQETQTLSDGTVQKVNVGGAYQYALIEEYKEKMIDPSTNKEVDIAGSTTGIYNITFSTYHLPSHGDNNVEWYKGTIRIPMPKSEEMRELKVVNIDNDSTQLVVKAVDPTYNVNANYTPAGTYVPIPKDTTLRVNFQPGYRAYLTVDSGLNEAITLPATGDGIKYTYMACNAIDDHDSSVIHSSYLSSTAVLVAREILTPIVPEAPKGGTYATRPNFFGKSTYTFETTLGTGRDPFLLIFYRATEQIILDTLYLPATVATIRAKLPKQDADAFLTNRWNDLISMTVDSNNQFKSYPDGGNQYAFPNPDNTSFMMSNRSGTCTIYPLNASYAPGSTNTVAGTDTIFGGALLTYKQVVLKAIQSAFTPLTEQPVLYRCLRDFNQGYLPSPEKPVIRDSEGNLLVPTQSGTGVLYNQAPMAVKYVTGAGVKTIRFTDYTIDGASTSLLFYYAKEMTNTMEVGDASNIAGPIQLVNANPPKAPEIRKFYTQMQDDSTQTVTSVVFEINNYIDSDQVSYVQIYRALTSTAAQDIRTMTALTPIAVGSQLIDKFSDLSPLPYGDPIYYRLVAIRKVKESLINYSSTDLSSMVDEGTVTSYPSSLMVANILDVVNPTAPTLKYTKDETTSTASLYKNVTLSWTPVVYNGTYYLYQMSNNGTWSKLAEKTYKEAKGGDLKYVLSSLKMKSDDGLTSYHYSFKVGVVNSAGLINLTDNVFTI